MQYSGEQVSTANDTTVKTGAKKCEKQQKKLWRQLENMRQMALFKKALLI